MTKNQIIAVRNVFKDMEALTDEEFFHQLELHKDTELARMLEYASQQDSGFDRAKDAPLCTCDGNPTKFCEIHGGWDIAPGNLP